MVRISLPEKARTILGMLRAAGFETYAVGGCVRDSLMGRQPQDWDITTSARPEEVKRLFAHTIDTGIRHGTVTVMLGREGFEVTTYRIDGKYEDARHPKEVEFTRSLAEDLKRRDFTMNAMAYNEEDGLVDLFGGLDDIRSQMIRCVGDPKERFEEDALRMMRTVRFAAQLGFSIEGRTREAVSLLAGNLRKISAERVQAELVKLLVSDHPEQVRTLSEIGISAAIFPWLDEMFATPQENPHHIYDVGEHTVQALTHVPADKDLRLTMLLHDIAKPRCRTVDAQGICHFYGHPKEGAAMARKVMRDWKFDNATTDRVCRLVLWHDHNPRLTPTKVRRTIHEIGPDAYPDLFAVKRADTMAQSDYQREEKLRYIEDYEALWREITERGDCISLKGLALTGRDLIAAGMAPGKGIGEMLGRLLDWVMENPSRNTRDNLMRKVEEWQNDD